MRPANPPRQKPPTAGELMRDAALGRVHCRRLPAVWSVQLAMLDAMLGRDDGTGCADDVTPAGQTYTGNAPHVGAAVRGLAERGLIVSAGFVRSTRPSRKANHVRRWRIADRAAAEAARRWLAMHLEPPDDELPGDGPLTPHPADPTPPDRPPQNETAPAHAAAVPLFGHWPDIVAGAATPAGVRDA